MCHLVCLLSAKRLTNNDVPLSDPILRPSTAALAVRANSAQDATTPVQSHRPATAGSAPVLPSPSSSKNLKEGEKKIRDNILFAKAEVERLERLLRAARAKHKQRLATPFERFVFSFMHVRSRTCEHAHLSPMPLRLIRSMRSMFEFVLLDWLSVLWESALRMCMRL